MSGLSPTRLIEVRADEYEQLEKDAFRYRWLRTHWFDVGGPLEGSGRSNVAKAADVETLDAAIDAARQADMRDAPTYVDGPVDPEQGRMP